MKKKKIVGMLISAVLCINHLPVYANESNITNGEIWYKDMVDTLLDKKIIHNADNPDSYLTRGDLVEILVGTGLFHDGGVLPVGDKSIFSDLEPTHTMYPSVALLFSRGVFQGARGKDGTLQANLEEYLTREQAVVFLTRAFGLRYDENNRWQFSDSTSISEYAKKSVRICQNLGVISGYPDQTLKPQNKIKKVEFLAMLYTVVNLHEIYQGAFCKEVPAFCEEIKADGDLDAATQELLLCLENTSTATYNFSDEYALEVMENNVWTAIKRLPLDDDGMLYGIEPGRKLSHNVNLENLFGRLLDGEYRLTLEVYPEGLYSFKQKVALIFTIEQN